MNRLHRWYCPSRHWSGTLARLMPWALDGATLGDRVLDLGAGIGLASPALAARGAHVTALDHDADALASLHRRLPADIAAIRADAVQLPFAGAAFSAVVAIAMLHHVAGVDRQQRLFSEARRVLRTGGIFVAVDVRPTLFLRLFHLGDVFSPLPVRDARRRLGDAGFTDIRIRVNDPYFVVAAR